MNDTQPNPASTSSDEGVQQQGDDFDLHSFFPYLVRVYYRAVSGSVSDVYGTLYDLTTSEWRIMAVLGTVRPLSASEIVERSSIDKVKVSRAIKSMQASGLLKRDIDGDDRRRAVLRLTEKGAKIYNTLIPKVKGREAQLLAGFSSEERRALIRMMEKVRENAQGILKESV